MCPRVALHFDKDQVGHWMYPQPHATKVWLTSWMQNADGAPPSGHTVFIFLYFAFSTYRYNVLVHFWVSVKM